ncbi:NAD(P)-binding domain-containing protein [Nocardiopsis sp. CT-R113]|uniref:NAD(P)-binding domain-containing protein n=1 Tax=Nocardiopsis codii TaxID=3065942 RepID=A0ABU7K9S9_9ACTN|nr:NAD(P)-binding domain-containing protein [Nocardiopsis sp. CT-R113]MEE2038654.1 NAD(P)-binding domain-containing protein [Nocardiopsis sp. CT-R113]
MTQTPSETDLTAKPRIALLGLGAMGAAFARTWLAAGYPLTVWNRTPSRAEPLAAEGADVAATAAEAVASARLVVTCLLDDASVGEALAGADLTGRDLVDVTTGTPAQARARSEWAAGRGARFLSGGIMAIPPMVGVPEAGGYVFYSGPSEVFEEHRAALAVPAGTVYAGRDAGLASLQDVALLSAMNGMFAGVAHAFALVRNEEVPLGEFAGHLSAWLVAMASEGVRLTARQLESGDYTTGVVSNLAMQVEGNATLLRTAEEQGVSTELLTPYADLMARRLADGHGDEDGAGVVDLLAAPRR